ncbi:MAG: hypothetical protein GF350_02785 [Chitinivibrionales bacterium]|nr:hypothetical protein [Chitinivibrionales bacterium]
MKWYLFACSLALAGFAFLMGCGDDDSNPAASSGSTVYIGEWVDTLPSNPFFLPRTVYMHAIIDEDSSYELYSWYEGNDTALIHIGTWTESGDTLFLTGDSCAVYDTTQQALAPRTCPQAPAAIPINISDNRWTIAIKDLDPVAEALNIDINDSMIQQVELILDKIN